MLYLLVGIIVAESLVILYLLLCEGTWKYRFRKVVRPHIVTFPQRLPRPEEIHDDFYCRPRRVTVFKDESDESIVERDESEAIDTYYVYVNPLTGEKFRTRTLRDEAWEKRCREEFPDGEGHI